MAPPPDTATRPHSRPDEQVRLRSADGTTLFATAYGPPAAPTLVLVHGLGLSLDSWQQVIDELAGQYRVIAYDLRGHGRSGHSPTRDYSLEAHAADLAAVLRTMTNGRPTVLVGHSLGGAVILARTKHSLDGIAGVVFVGSAAAVVTVPGLPARGLPDPARRAVIRLWLAVLRTTAALARPMRHAAPVTNAVGRRLLFAPDDPDSAVDRARHSFLGTDPDVLARTSLASVRADHSRPARRVPVPALALRGDQDKEADTADTRKLLDRLPDGHLVTLPGRGHMLPMTDGCLVAEHITRFVAGDR
ncbi:Pimeloyl-ACP methyl ester carboxylesterase [Micromonospora nigra]|uniref:Pimeloyl-ACP methyl ester carboxylesterase n=1 Tax=Micromonospora nigra TaxID=145857 RepID=A0A1C6S812_9ACTN|nr:alpha/beta hydrolase [Micromonospora nigra]SCL25617.1 Pimeloyl-ACP methyl ester carboxylesterase [Micromonospora nigra]